MAKQNYISEGGFSVNLLSIENLPNKVIESKAELISFCFLLLGISEESCRKTIDCSKITEKFWREIKKLKDYEQSFNNFTEKDLNNTFKYIVYLPAYQKFEINLVLKTYFRLLESNLIDNNQPIAEIGKTMLYWLIKIKDFSKINSSKNKDSIDNEQLNFTNEILEYNIADLYINVEKFKNPNNNEFKFIFNEFINKKKSISNTINSISNTSLNLDENNTTSDKIEKNISNLSNNTLKNQNNNHLLSTSNFNIKEKISDKSSFLSDFFSKISKRLFENSKEESEAVLVEVVKQNKIDSITNCNNKINNDFLLVSNNDNLVSKDNKSKPHILVFYTKNLSISSDNNVDSMRMYLKNKIVTNSNVSNINIRSKNIFHDNESKAKVLWDKLSLLNKSC